MNKALSWSRLSKLLFGATLLLTITACGSDSGQSVSAEAEEDIQLRATNFASWDQQLASYQPSVVVLDLWAMWCTPCIKRFPAMVEMHHHYKDRGVEIVAVNLDNRDDHAALEQAEQFIREVEAEFDNFFMDENLIAAFEHFNLIGIPAVLIYDGQGRERFRLTGNNPNSQFTDKDIEAAIEQLLAEQSQGI